MNDKFRNMVSTLISIVLFLVLYISLKWNIVVSSVLAIITYFGTFLITKPQYRLGNVELEALENGEELKQLMDTADSDLAIINTTINKIKNYDIKNKAQSLQVTGANIISHLKDNPDKISKSRRFLNYYLDAFKDILTKYYNIEKMNVVTSESEKITEQTKNALVILHDAFKKQFMKLNSNEIMDIEADIKLLEQQLKEE